MKATPAVILRIAAKHYGVPMEDLLGPSRDHPLPHVRHLVAYVAKQRGANPYAIGLALCRDRTTILYAVAKITERASRSEALCREIAYLLARVGDWELAQPAPQGAPVAPHEASA